MSDELNPISAEQPERPAGYPKGRYTFFLVVLAILIVLIASARFIRPSRVSPPDTEKEVLQANLSMKFYYFTQYLSPTTSQRSPFEFPTSPRRHKDKDLRQAAIRQYTLAVSKNPSVYNIRRLIIVETPDKRPWAISQFSKVLHPELEAGLTKRDYGDEVRMWRAIYVSKTKLSATDVTKYQSKLDELSLGWYGRLVQAELYDRAGMTDRASSERKQAALSAAAIVVPLTFMIIGFLVLMLVGVVIDIYYLASGTYARQALPNDVQSLHVVEKSRVSGVLLESFVVYMLIFVISQLFLGEVFSFVIRRGWLYPNPTTVTAVMAFDSLVWNLLALAYLVYRVRRVGLNLAGLGLKASNLWGDIRWGIAGYVAGLPIVVIVSIISQILTRQFKTPPNPVQTLLIASDSWFARIVILLLLSVSAPFFEELFFRGTLFNSLRARSTIIGAVIVSAVVFAGVHPLPMGFLPIFTLGSIFSILFYHRGSLVPNMTAHCLHNTMLFILVTLLTS